MLCPILPLLFHFSSLLYFFISLEFCVIFFLFSTVHIPTLHSQNFFIENGRPILLHLLEGWCMSVAGGSDEGVLSVPMGEFSVADSTDAMFIFF